MIPAIPYMRAVKQYAHSRGLNFFTWTDFQIAIRLYNEHAKINN
jgi:hypothetical protein